MTPPDFEPGYRPTLRIPEARVGVRPGRLRIERTGDHAVEFDEEGRLVRIEHEGTSLRTTLDLRLIPSRVHGHGPRRRLERDLPVIDDLDRVAAAHAEAHEVLRAAGTIDDDATRDWLERIARWDADSLAADRARLRRIYRPIPVLPPDQYASLVVQLTEGCPWDRCTFCDFYRGVRHRIRSHDEVAAHVDTLLAHLGRSLDRCRRVFLGQANALLIPPHTLRDRLALLRDRLPSSLHEFYSFVDAFHRIPTAEDLAPLRDFDLRRVYVGVESGSETVLEQLGKPLDTDAVVALVEAFHGAGIGVGVILLVGAGGPRLADGHRRATRDLVARLGLGRGDQVYLSRLVVHEGSEYQERARAEGLGTFTPAELAAEEDELRRTLGFVRDHGAVIASYDLGRIAAWSPRSE